MIDRLRQVSKVLAGLCASEITRVARPGRAAGGTDADARSRHRAREIRLALERLGPFYVKVGQMLSTRPDIVPQPVIDELAKLHDQVSPVPFAVFEPVLEGELGPDWKERFQDFDLYEPLGAASLAQVYRVTLRDGRPGVVKVQRPGIREVVLQDMALLRRAARFVGKRAPRFNAVIDVDAMLGVLFDAMRPELDFVVEAGNMERARELAHRFATLTVPEVVLATPRVLVQTLAPGRSVRDADRAAFTEQERKAIGSDLLAMMYRGFFVDRMFHADPHPGNIFVHPGQRASLIDWGMVGRVDRRTSLAIVLILLTLAQNDGHGLARAWAELGHATPWADLGGFAADMAALTPKIVHASLSDLNFGVTLTAVLQRSTKRGIKTSPMVSVLGKAFGNIEGSVRYLAPELSITDVFREQLTKIMLELAGEFLSQQQLARTAVELMIGATTAVEQTRGILRDLSNREFTIQQANHDNRTPTHRYLPALIALALWSRHRRSPDSGA